MEITEIKSRLGIEQVLRHYGITINRNGHIQCPFHDDKQVSMKVYRDTNTVYCFAGSCPTTGHSLDAIDFILHREKCSKHEALKKAAELCGELPALPKKEEKAPKVAVNLTLEEVFASMRNGLLRTASAQKYLAGRGLDYLNLEIGYSSGQMHYHKESQYLSDLEALGIIKPLERGGYLTFAKNGVVFPLKDSTGRVCSLYGRSIEGKNHYYLSGRSGLYPGYPPSETKRVILTESVIDAASLLQIKDLSDYFILALYGTNGLTAEHKNALQSLPQLEALIIMLDGDEAGRKAASSIKTELSQFFLSIEKSSVEVKNIELPENSDINELWANHGSAEQFLELLAQSPTKPIKSTKKPIEKPLEKAAPQGLNCDDEYNWTWNGALGLHSIKGGVDLKHWEQLKVTWVLEANGLQSRQKLDLYDDKQIEKACDAAARKLRLKADELEKELNELTQLIEKQRRSLAKAIKTEEKTVLELSPEHRQSALAFLQAPNLLERLNESIGATGIVGEEKARLMLLLIASSYMQKRPLHALIQGSSGSGKTLLLRKVMELLPPGESYLWSRVTESSLYNWGERLRQKAIGIEDWDGLTEEAQYALRELQTGGELRSSTSEKLENGKIEARERVTSGPIASLMCTTKGSIYEDNMNRCFLLAVDEGEEQTLRILAYQNAVAEGLVERASQLSAIEKIRHLIKTLQPCEV